MHKFIWLMLGCLPFQLLAQTDIELPKVPGTVSRTTTIDFQMTANASPIPLEVQVIDGLVVFGGDMILGDESTMNGGGGYQTNLVGVRDERRWPNGVIPYKPPASNHPCRQAILNAIKAYNQQTNVCFREYNNDPYYISFGSNNCNAIVGYNSLTNSRPVNVSPSCGCNALHELGHVIGLFHEHQSPKRDDHVEVLWNNIPQDKRHNYLKVPSQYGYHLPVTSYDFASIMHYPARARYNQRTVDILKCKGGANCGLRSQPNTSLSADDIEGVNWLYTQKATCESPAYSSLFLFDLSGSMNEAGRSGQAKIAEAKAAATAALQQLSQQQGVRQQVALTAFSGACVEHPMRPADPTFTEDINAAISVVNRLPSPGGGTPLPKAIEQAERTFQAFLQQQTLKKGRLIILSDGQSTCGSIRPADVYAFGQGGYTVRNYAQGGNNASNRQSPTISNTNSPIRYYTIGFNIPPGSAAERDLQFLAQQSGGKYLNAQSQLELTQALRKFNRFYVPKPNPATSALSTSGQEAFYAAVGMIDNEVYEQALQACRNFSKDHPDDCHGVYNLALMSEANDLYKAAYQNYQRYLDLCPAAIDRQGVEARIIELQKEYAAYLEYNRKVITSDMAYLDLYFKKIQNGESVALALEFVGFLKEKYHYYQYLPAILERADERVFQANAREVFRGLEDCVAKIKANPQKWDREATPVLSRTYFNMNRLLSDF